MKRILIVEDDITFSTMLKSWLGKKGFDVSTASNISKAKKSIDTQTPDIILSDLRLPDEDGTQLLIWMNENGVNIPFIIMTSYAEIQTAVLAMKLGANDYISKPINPDELLKKLDEALSLPKNNLSIANNNNEVKANTITSDNNSNYLEGKSQVAQQLY